MVRAACGTKLCATALVWLRRQDTGIHACSLNTIGQRRSGAAACARRAPDAANDPMPLAAMIVFFFLMLLIGIGLMLALTPTGTQTIASAASAVHRA